jgi:hypothetical protein
MLFDFLYKSTMYQYLTRKNTLHYNKELFMQDPFVKPVDEYVRKLNPLGDYVHDCRLYLELMTGASEEEVRGFISKALRPGGVFEFKDPKVEYLERNEFGDRELKEGTLKQYIDESIAAGDIIAPTFTTYINTKKKKSLLAKYIDGNIALRNKAKKAMFVAKANKDAQLYTFKKSEQTNRKLKNNAVSGAHVTPSTPLFNKTAHSTLTSVCRSTSGYGNADNEKLLSGNRHYRDWRTVNNNIISIVGHTDYDALIGVIQKYNLVIPSIEQALACVKYSTDLYFRNDLWIQKIRSTIEKLNGFQRAAFVYTGDLYQVLLLNESFMRAFITRLSNKIKGVCPSAQKVIENAPDAYVNLAHQICEEEARGIGKDYSKVRKPEDIDTLALTILNAQQTVQEYADFIKVIMVSDNIPASVGYFPESIRRAAVLSDTDSTIFTVQDWVIWYEGELNFSERAIAMQATMTFIASSAIVHILATMSANMGVDKEYMFRIAMKSEFRFDVFVPTQLGKHYYAGIGCQEGNILDPSDLEIKGVHLKNSNINKEIISRSKDMMVDIMDTVKAGKKISIMKYLKIVAEIEREIMDSLLRGESKYIRFGSIKEKESYTKEEEESPYQNHNFWMEVWSQSYGEVAPPPYGTVKISLTTDNTRKTRAWIESFKDRELAERLSRYMVKNEKMFISTFHLPAPILQAVGIPEEVKQVIDFRKLVSELCKSFYLVLETLGFYTNDDKITRLVSDYYS